MIKKHLFVALACVGLSALMSGCFGGGAGVSAKVDPKVLENKDEVQKIYDAVIKCMGAQASKADEITISINNPADKGKTGDSYLTMIIDMQDQKKPKQLVRQLFHGELGRWLPMQEVTVQAPYGNKENFRLEDELFDFTKITAEKLYNLIQDAYNKNNDGAEKYAYRYVERVNIDINGIRIDVKGKLEANDQVISKYSVYDLEGNPQK
ncbi:hypothetical protein FACS189429_6360 [Bacteroidia bacterium]|nr:hypothetical protein FACS189429_6360 [Bacteroidia bacterium]